MICRKQYLTCCAALLPIFGMSACGDGEDGGGLGMLAPSQQIADQVVGELNSLVLQIRQIPATYLLPSEAPDVNTEGATRTSESIDCATFRGAAGFGVGTIDVTHSYQRDDGRPISESYSLDRCSFVLFFSYFHMHGSAALTYTEFVDDENYAFTKKHDFHFGDNTDGTLTEFSVDIAQSCSVDDAVRQCSFRAGGYQIDDSLDVSTFDYVTHASEAVVTNEHVTIVFENWIYDSRVHRATSGSALVTDTDGSTALIAATGSGYTVTITTDGAASTWAVDFD